MQLGIDRLLVDAALAASCVAVELPCSPIQHR
jgi:hypothetical protein